MLVKQCNFELEVPSAHLSMVSDVPHLQILERREFNCEACFELIASVQH